MTTLTVTKVKSFTGMEGYGYNADLLLDGKKVALVIDDASGGPVDFQWVSKAAEQQVKAHVDALPPEPFSLEYRLRHHPSGFRKVTLDCLMGALIDDFENDKRFARQNKTAVSFVLPEHKPGNYATIKHNGDPERIRKHIAAKFPAAVIFSTSAELRAARESFSTAGKKAAPAPVPAAKKAEPKKAAAQPTQDNLGQMSLDDLYSAAAAHGIPDCNTRWKHLGVGMQKMQLIQAIRKAIKAA